jgi:nitrite reductase [NAD(P)H] large subunit
MTNHEPHAIPSAASALRLTQPPEKPALEAEPGARHSVPSPQGGGGSRRGRAQGSQNRQRLVIVGGGMAALKLIEEVVALCPGRYEIVLVGRESRPPYNRVLLSSLLAGEIDAADIELRPASWFADNGVELACGDPACELHPGKREVTLASGVRLGYDRLALATGSNAIRLPIPGHQLSGVTTFRDLADVEELRIAEAGGRAVVIGGGLLGIEAAYGLSRRGLAVTLLHIMPRLMERQLDGPAAALLKTAIERIGIEVVLEAWTVAIEGDGRAERVVLKDGRTVPASLVIMAAGVQPEASLARHAGVAVGRGILVDDKLETSWPAVYAIGDCAEHCGICNGLVEPAYAQAKTLAHHLAGLPAHYENSLPATNLKVSGVPVFSMGDFEGDAAETIVLEDQEAGTYRKLVVRDNRLTGAVLIGDTADSLWYRDLMFTRAPVAPFRDVLAFGRAWAERQAA